METIVVGRVIGKDNHGRIMARVDHRVMPEFGALWIIDDKDKEVPERYFVRVVDTTYAADSRDASDYAKALLDNPAMTIDEIDREYIGFNFAVIDLLGVVTQDNIADFYRIPSILAEIREPTDEEYALVVK